ncbi:tRNA pseudouridine(13) synthase TruD [Helicobacter sp. 16-1353]|uniref:tRNA pseudouridine(13) synthase TruD n=1 Tax=Helicobacter sp. 16-1353 TaxID=2004996 RepID=UPI000DCEC5BB|nr:tRNA pseudouridine(13) synthase TruD [Helicobacter sp. 16-1353]RAX54242.1 tRNA pseudouridine(13) synthase TruD [Helicobacter sp. 16-1353]
MDLLSHLSHSPIDFYFSKNPRNFIVEEIPLYPFSGSGEHLIIKIRKKNLSTMEMLNILSKNLNIKRFEIGYAGLKDKNALTTQYISINKKLAKNIESLQIENIKILDITYHENKIKLGHLKGNKFFIRLKKLNKIDAEKLKNACRIVLDSGIPNYFGAQRFGKNGDNYKEGKAILEKTLRIRDRKISQFLISSYQSYLFNKWLNYRVKFSKIINDFSVNEAMKILQLDSALIKNLKTQKHFFKLLIGDVMQHYPNGKLFFNEDSSVIKAESIEDSINEDSAIRFYNHKIAPTGLLYGSKSVLSKDLAFKIECNFIDKLLDGELGQRRFAWIFLENLEFIYKEDIANGELNFALPKGSYATILLELLANRPIKEEFIDEF